MMGIYGSLPVTPTESVFKKDVVPDSLSAMQLKEYIQKATTFGMMVSFMVVCVSRLLA